MNDWGRYPIKALKAKAYRARIYGWQTIEDLVSRAGNPWSPSMPFLNDLAVLAAQAKGPILDLGSGLSTEVLRRFSSQRVVSLDQDKGWALKAKAIHAPVDLNTGWYELFYLPDLTYSLVVVDGPSGYDRAGFVWLPLSKGAVFVVDDMELGWYGPRVIKAILSQCACNIEIKGSKDSYAIVRT